MPRTLIQAAILPAAPERLFDMYLDPESHAAFTGSPVEISEKIGSAFRAFDGVLEGVMLHTQPKRVIVQSWRSSGWESEAVDSTLILSFHSHESAEGDAGRIELVHTGLPESDYAGVSQGWEKFYWSRWRAYLEENA